eukprot:TRINITY_DN727_c0_g1_i1.p1 TRINITY_DN727_c0_g1~~TRINITY_DN727_c0_g1_i1.p1  ORF type:complete len:350 (-),score=93.91 TRINITY_DN727_c0_g1_i1:37-1086(-)
MRKTSPSPLSLSAFCFFALLFVCALPLTQQAVCGIDTCVLHPELTQGPYWVDLELVREDITEGKPGIPLTLAVTVVNSNTCEVIPNAGVELWHCDSVGVYSHYEQASNNVANPQTDNTTYLRGIQMTDQTGVAKLNTVYPGWYNGRTIHIHLKVHLGGSVVGDSSLVDSTIVHTGQLFMNDSLNSEIAKFAPYSSHGDVVLMKLSEDGIYNGGGSYGLVDFQFVDASLGVEGGLIGNVTVAVDINSTSSNNFTMGGGGDGVMNSTRPAGNFTGSPPGNFTGSAPPTTSPSSTTASPSTSSTLSSTASSSTTASPSTSSSTLSSSASPFSVGFGFGLICLFMSFLVIFSA